MQKITNCCSYSKTIKSDSNYYILTEANDLLENFVEVGILNKISRCEILRKAIIISQQERQDVVFCSETKQQDYQFEAATSLFLKRQYTQR